MRSQNPEQRSKATFSGRPGAPAIVLLCVPQFGLTARASISANPPPHPKDSPRPLYRGAPGAPSSALLRGPQYRSGSGHGPVSRPPRIAVQGRIFGAPQGLPPALCSVALTFCPHFLVRAMAAVIFDPQNGYRSQQRQQWSGTTNSGSASCTSP